MAIVVREKEIVVSYINGNGEEAVQVVRANVESNSPETAGYSKEDGFVTVWKQSSTGHETTSFPRERVIFVRQVDRP